VVSAPLNARIQELEEQLQSQDEAYNLLQVEHDERGDLMLDLNDQLGAAEKEANELDARLTEETVNKASFQEHLVIRTEERDEYALVVEANAHLLEKIKGEQFAMLLIEELKDCATVAEVDEKWDAAKETVEALALNTPGPDGKAVINDTEPPDPGTQKNDSAVHRLQEVMGGFTAP
jgi:chromosome segregation ATPase